MEDQEQRITGNSELPTGFFEVNMEKENSAIFSSIEHPELGIKFITFHQPTFIEEDFDVLLKYWDENVEAAEKLEKDLEDLGKEIPLENSIRSLNEELNEVRGEESKLYMMPRENMGKARQLLSIIQMLRQIEHQIRRHYSGLDYGYFDMDRLYDDRMDIFENILEDCENMCESILYGSN